MLNEAISPPFTRFCHFLSRQNLGKDNDKIAMEATQPGQRFIPRKNQNGNTRADTLDQSVHPAYFTTTVHNIFHQNWSLVESSKSSTCTWRELKTVDLPLSAFAPGLQCKKVAWFTDNTSVVSIVCYILRRMEAKTSG